ncbi:DUF4214 domain-containing protein [Pseudomonas sp. DSP3-2-2]|uniref:DUF4214 domain-containing protein n=1 Tax=unclassified Pseudomonas TaxID=196821 RepID=UPI003CEF421A
MAASTYFDQVQQLYIAYFGRPADTVGQAYWADRIDAANGSIASVIAGFSASAESLALFGTATSAQKVTAIYQNAFGRAPEAAGLAYWVAQLDSGKVSQAQASWTIQQAAGPGDASAVNNKLIAAKAFTAQIDTNAEIAGYNGAAAAALARTYLSKADATYASIANVAVDSVAAVGAATGTVVVTPPVTPVTPVPTFTATKDGGNVVTFANAGTAISVTEALGTYTFTSNGVNAGSATATGTISGITVAASTTLSITSLLAAGKGFTGAGTIALTDTGSVTAAALKAIEAATTVGLVNATAVTATSGSVADVKLVLVTNEGTTGNKIDMGPTVAVTLNDAAATGILATDLSAIGSATTGVVAVTNSINITGTVAEATAALVTADSLVVAGAATVALSGTTALASALTAIDAKTTGLITATSITSVTGTVDEVKAFADATGLTITKAANYSVTLTGAVDSTSINAIDTNNGNGTITYNIGNTGSTVSFAGVTGAVTIVGGTGADVITGGAGADILTGGGGANKFVIGNNDSGIAQAAADRITDFVVGVDKLALGVASSATNTTIVNTAVADYATALAAANVSFAADTGGLQEYYVANNGIDTFVFVDNGATQTSADQAIILTGVKVLTFADIIAA